jgi:cyanophycin synthetase
MHLYPSEGKPRDVGGHIIEMLYPTGDDGRIPIISITGTNGKTTVTRMIGHVLAQMGLTVGMTTTDGIYNGDRRIVEGDTTGPHSARTVLSDPAVEVAVLETARGGIVRRGLGYDWSDIGVITNIGPDHIGQDGIESIEDLVNIKALVAERVRAGGALILNADDEHLRRLTEIRRVREPRRRVVYFSLHENNPFIAGHIAAGNTAYFLRDGLIVEVNDREEQPLARVADVPCTMNGTAEFQIANLLAATAACRAYGVTGEHLRTSLKTFNSDYNPGRANLYEVNGGYVMVDYGHNPDAFAAVCRMAAMWNERRVTGIIGVPGDRDDSVIEQAGRVAGRGFHCVIIKEDKDLRGREKGEVARLLCEAVKDESPDTECHIVLDEIEALRSEIERIEDGQVIVVFYDRLEPVLNVLEEAGAVPVLTIGESKLVGLEQRAEGLPALAM